MWEHRENRPAVGGSTLPPRKGHHSETVVKRMGREAWGLWRLCKAHISARLGDQCRARKGDLGSVCSPRRSQSQSRAFIWISLCNEQTVTQVRRNRSRSQGTVCTQAVRWLGQDSTGETGCLECVGQVESLDKVHTTKSAVVAAFVEVPPRGQTHSNILQPESYSQVCVRSYYSTQILFPRWISCHQLPEKKILA